MIFWIAIAILAGGLGLALARPLMRGAGEAAPARGAYDMQVYRDQLAEIDRDRARGVLSDDQAAAARIEVERRLIAAGESASRDRAAKTSAAPLLAAGLAILVPVVALLVYGQLGRPGTPGQPFAQRLDRNPATTQVAGQGAGQPPGPNAADPHPAGGGTAESMASLTDRLAKRLEANPGDAEGWALLARSYQQLNKYREAVAALERAVALTNRDPQLVATLGEARIMAADGSVTPQARGEFEEALKAEPKDPRARFYIAIAETQAGNMMKGLDQLVGIARDATPDAPYLPMLRERIGSLAAELKQDPNRILASVPTPSDQPPPPQAAPPPPRQQAAAPPPSAPPAGGPRQERGPTAADVQAAQQMSSGDRQAMIRGMVDGLAARLDSDPSDVEGWQKLIRAYKVLGEDAKAGEAAARASAANPGARPQILAMAQQMGVSVPSAPQVASAQPRPLDAAQIRSGAGAGDAAAYRRRLDGNPNDREALWQVGLAEVAAGNKIAAAELWGRLLGQFDPSSAEFAALRERLDALKRGG